MTADVNGMMAFDPDSLFDKEPTQDGEPLAIDWDNFIQQNTLTDLPSILSGELPKHDSLDHSKGKEKA